MSINISCNGQLLTLVELKLKEVISREPTLLVMVVGIPNVGKSALINSIYQIASSRFPGNIGSTISEDFLLTSIKLTGSNKFLFQYRTK